MITRIFFVLAFACCFSNSLHAQKAVPAFTVSRSFLIDHPDRLPSIRPAADLAICYKERRAGRVMLGLTRNHAPIEAFFFPGTSDKKALLLAGVHGSELSGIEVAKTVLALLASGPRPYYNVVVVPCLFPDNAEKALLANDSKTNCGRYTTSQHADPNRQMPIPGTAFDSTKGLDAKGREIEHENQLLLQLIQTYQPSRIANIHAIRDTAKAGIYADPRTDCKGIALGFESDEKLAIATASFIARSGGAVPGNQLSQKPTAVYYMDPSVAPSGMLQQRNFTGSPLQKELGAGVSLGTWASTAVCDDKAPRDACRLFTVEFPGYRASAQHARSVERENCKRNVRLYAEAIVAVFLQPVSVE